MARVLFGERGGSQDYFPAPIPYRDVTLPEKLRFGYYLNGASCATLDCAGVDVYMHTKTQTDWSRGLLLAIGPCWKRWKHFARQDMNASRSTRRMVRENIFLYLAANLNLVPVTESLRLFTGITSADGYQKLTEHLGPDKKACPLKYASL